MAYQRSTQPVILGDSLDSFVAGISTMYKNQQATRNAALELKFQTAVQQGNISLQDQLDFRKGQLEDVSDDPSEKQRIQVAINDLSAQIEQKTFDDAYTSKVTDFVSGASSIDSLINWMQNTLASTTDPTIQTKINSDLETFKQKKFDLTQSMLKDQTTYAENNGTASVIQPQVSKLQTAKANALIAGDEVTAASLDLQIQSLQKTLNTNSIESSIKDMAVATASGFSTATDLLNLYSNKIRSADISTPVTIGGVTYQNSQDYWTYARNNYLSDQSQSGFFQRVDSELQNNIKVKNSNNTLTAADLQAASSTYDAIAARPELANYVAPLAYAKADTLQTAADLISQKIVNTFDNNLDLKSAVASLTSLKSMGVNVDAAYQKILTSAAATQSTSLQNIIQNAQTLMANSPGMSISDAVSQAISKGSGIILSPNDLTAKTPGQNANDILGQTTTGAVPADNRTTLPNGQPAPGATGAPAAGGSYVIKSGDTLSKIAAVNGTTVAALAALNGIADPNKIQSGATLKLPGAPAAPAPAGTPPPGTAVAPGAQTPTAPVAGQGGHVGPDGVYVPAPGAPASSGGGTSVQNPTVDVSGKVADLRNQIQNGSVTPGDAFNQLYQEIVKQSTTKYGTSISGDVVHAAQAALYAPLQINAGGKQANLNSDGSVTMLTTTTNKSDTSISGGGTTTSTSYKTPPQQPVQQPVQQTQPAPGTQTAPAPAATPSVSTQTPAPTVTPAPAASKAAKSYTVGKGTFTSLEAANQEAADLKKYFGQTVSVVPNY